MTILIVDDEEWNVSKLTELLNIYTGLTTEDNTDAIDKEIDRYLEGNTSEIDLEDLAGSCESPSQYDYASSVEDALTLLRDGATYEAVITDFNIGYLNGKQLLKIITGRLTPEFDIDKASKMEDLKAAEPEVYERIRNVFGTVKAYKSMVERNKNIAKVMFSSTLYGDGQQDWVLEGAESFQKENHSTDNSIEKQILIHLSEKGVLEPERVSQTMQTNSLSEFY